MLDVQEIGRYRENNRIEAKRAVGGFPRSLWETYSAFANTLGGVILLGVEERPDKSFHPVRLPDPQWLVDTFWQQVNNVKIANRNILERDQVRIIEAEGQQIVMIEVPRAKRWQRPVYVGESVYQGTYQRTGEGDYRCDKAEVDRMLEQQRQIDFDMELLLDRTVADLNEATVERYCQVYAARRLGQWAELGSYDVLRQVGAVGVDGHGQLHPTRAGLLLLGKQEAIVQVFPGYFLVYREKGANELRWRSVFDTRQAGERQGNLLEFYFFAVQRLQAHIATLKLSESEQQAVDRSVAEGVANGLMHANYENQRGIVVSRQHRAVVIANPGSLQLEAERLMRTQLSLPRNELLMHLFQQIGIGRGVGSGLPGITAVWKRQGWMAPRLEHYFSLGSTVLTLVFSSEDQTVVQEMQQEVLVDYITTHIAVTLFDVSRLLQISLPAARAVIQQLLQKGILEQEGSRYRLKS